MIDNLAIRLHRAGKIKDLYEGLDWTSRLLRMRQDFPDAPVILIKGGVLPESLQQMFSDDRILDIAAQLGVGPACALNAAWNLRGKMPSHEETVVPWHQGKCSRSLCVFFRSLKEAAAQTTTSASRTTPPTCWWRTSFSRMATARPSAPSPTATGCAGISRT